MNFLLQPAVFIGSLIVLVLAAVLAFLRAQKDEQKTDAARQAELAEGKKKLFEVEKFLEKVKVGIDAASTELEARRQEVAAVTRERDVLLAGQEQLKAQVTTFKQEAANNASLLQEELRKKKEGGDAEQQLEELKSRVSSLSAERDSLKKQLAEAEEKFNELFAQFAAEQKKNKPLPPAISAPDIELPRPPAA